MIQTMELVKALSGLGRTPEEVADSLAAKGIVGRRLSGQNCPVARYLQEQFPEEQPRVTATRIIDHDVMTEFGIIPEAVTSFIVRFDQGKYPELDELRTEE